MKPRTITAAAAAALLSLVPHSQAQNASLQVLASRGVQAVVEGLLPQIEHSMGRKAAVQYSSSTDLKAKIEAGELFDVAIVTTELMDELVKTVRGIPVTRVPW